MFYLSGKAPETGEKKMNCENCENLGKVKLEGGAILCEDCFDLMVRLNRN